MKIKRLLMALLLVCAAFLLASCGENKPAEEGGQTPPPSEQPTEPSQPAHEHSAAAEWTYDENGHWHACSGCDEKLDMVAHAYDAGVETLAPAHGVKGEKTFTCVCGHSYKEEIDALEHDVVTEWTYDENKHWHKCSCDAKLDEADHEFAEEITKPAECGVAGEKTLTCVCGYSCTEEIPALVHAPSEDWTYDENKHWHACPNCEVKADEADHEFAEEITKPAEHGVKGEKTLTCECGYSYTEEIAALEHVYGEGVMTLPTADLLGNILYSCECGDSYAEYIPTLGNVYLNAGGAAMWDKDSARFAVYTWDGGDQWFDMVKIEGTDIYTVKLPAGISNIIFVRMNGSTTANNWNNKWDQTNDLKLPLDGTNLYTITSWGQNTNWKGVGSWSTQTVEHEHDLKWANDENKHWHLCEACGYTADEAEHAYVDAFGNGYKWTECECGLKTEEVVALTYDGTFAGFVDADAETGLYVLPKLAFKTWNRISFSYNGVLLSLDNATFEGLFIPEVAGAPWDERLYTEDKSLWLCSKGAGAEYIFSFDPETMTVTSILGGLKWGGTWNETAEKNAEGVYVVTKTFAQWNRITLTYDGKLLKLEDLTVTGAFSPEGATSSPKLYHEDGLFLYAGAAKVTFVISFDPETMTLNIEEQKLPANQMAVVVGQDVGDNKVALWQAGTTIKGADGKWLGNGWRLYVVVDAEGKIAYMVKMPPNGYGNPAGDSWYSHSSLREENSAWEVTDGGYTITVPEGGFALTTYGEAINTLLELLGTDKTADADINKAGVLDDNIRISFNAETGIITVNRVEAE